MKLAALILSMAFLAGANLFAAEEFFELSRESLDKIQADEFVKMKKTFAESPSYFQANKDLDIPKAIAFEDSREKIRLAPGDVIKISEELTFSDWGGASANSQVAEEDFTLPEDKVKKTEEEGAKTNIKFSRKPS
jgi:hypothetical protein